jgi:hypothetical protein
MSTIIDENLLVPDRWGLPIEVITNLGNRLKDYRARYQGCFKTKTGDSAEHAWTYLRGLIGSKTGRICQYCSLGHRSSGRWAEFAAIYVRLALGGAGGDRNGSI